MLVLPIQEGPSVALENVGGFTLRSLDRINVVLGKNGCGKSNLLRKIEPAIRSKPGRRY